VSAIRAIGATPVIGIESYWGPARDQRDAMDFKNHPDWAFCSSGQEPLVAQPAGRSNWNVLDANERPALDAFRAYVAKLKSEGWTGVFLDRGLAALTGQDDSKLGIWNKASTCTGDPSVPGATLADAYVGLLRVLHESGVQVFMNYGYSPFNPTIPMRPDPHDAACEPGKSPCRTLDDVWPAIDYVVDEAPAHPQDQMWDFDFQSNRANEKDTAHGARVVTLVTTGTLGGDNTLNNRDNVYFEFARIKLFDVPVAINTGDDNCGGRSGLCNRFGIYPELTTLRFGHPTIDEPASAACDTGSTINCVWWRTYEHGAIIVNASPNTHETDVPLTTNGQCEQVTDVFGDLGIPPGQCVATVHVTLPPWSGRVLTFSSASG
jgi:hypothetical protein